ncbi:MAG: RimK family alpha-L-glutamate ligase [Alphaproteobacteria bacterium]|nr:RimK family alpha-L-glutamate ligase [Alphaproteobacteria bacterium]
MSRSPEAATPLPAAAPPCIALMADAADWHARGLMRAFTAAGARARMVKLSACGIDTAAGGLDLPGFAGGLPDAVMVRTVPGGSFEAVTLRLGVLHALDALGVPVWNNARAIERCVDKSMTSFLLARAGIPTPPTWAVQSAQQAAAILEREAAPLVLKPLFGSQGRGLRLIRSLGDLPPPAEIAGVYYLQRYVGVERQGFQDFRVLVVRGRVIATMMRHASHWITNVKRGGKPVSAVADATMKDLAIAAAAAVGADFAGVDIIHDAAGRALVLEVNSMPAWSGLQRTTTVSIAAVLSSELMATLAARAQSRA